jgi:tRNA(Ile)-lysidine synthase
VAYSGGRDSTALLHATASSARALGDMRVLALHVHHGLNRHADAWLQHGSDLCCRWARRGLPVEFFAQRLEDKPARGESVEAWARRARYKTLRRMAIEQGADLVLLAHHRRDQAETFLLQALRGGGIAGLSAMPVLVRRDGVSWARPWLGQSSEAIAAYVRRHRLVHIEDDSNDDPRFARNRLRVDVWPTLLGAFPQAEVALATAAGWAQEAATGLDELAEIDLRVVARDDGLDILAWRALSRVRQSNALRAWLRQRTGAATAASLVSRLLDEARAGSSQCWPVSGAGDIRAYRGRLRFESVAGASHAGPTMSVDLSQAGVHPMPGWRGAFIVEEHGSGGLPVAIAARLEVRERRAEDRFQAGPGRPPRSLKLQYQAAAVPSWQRRGPILCHAGIPVFVPALGVDERARAVDGQAQVRLSWRFD